ncbi:MAG: ATP-binding cassette domain-containing protein [Gammaproteobacteria bacterium]
MIRIESLSLQRGAKALFIQASVTLNPGEKIGLIGVNGAGKSTLFDLLRGVLHADGGELSVPQNWRIAHVMQEVPAVDRSALDYALDGDTRLRSIEARIAAAHRNHDGLAEAQAHIEFADADGYTAPARTEALLLGLGFTLEQTRLPVASFSGGWRMRLNLAQALMCPSDLLLLDEPTNHLDLDAIVWLETWLQRYAGTLITISHDREFLDAICDVTLHIHDHRLQRYSGNYSQFEIQRAAQLTLQQAAFEKKQKHIDHLQSYIDRFRYKASKSRQAQSRIKALEKMERIAPVHAASEFSFSFRAPKAAPDPMLALEDVACGYHTHSGEHTVLSDVNLSIQNGQRIGLLGANGQGKSTLVKTLAGVLAPLTGEMRSGKGLQIGYFAQHQLETLHPEASPLLHLQRMAPRVREQELRDFLGSFNFRGEMATSPVGPFSGGEKARLALALIIWRQPNLLLLDEPTNNLDLETRHALTLALAEFEGTLILVSHDRFLLRATTEQFMLVAHGGLQAFDGDLDDYRGWLITQTTEKRAAVQGNNRGDTSSTNRKQQRRAEAEERQQLAHQRKPLLKELVRQEQALEKLTAEKARLDAVLADALTYSESNSPLLAESLKRHAQVVAELEDVETLWMETQAQLEKFT